MSKYPILVTTSDSIDGHQVESYQGIVTSHIVAGTGILSDFMASFSDFFGGRSNAYKNQLESIKEEAISEIVEKSIRLHANAIIGLKLDFDEISGKGHQMLMVTAYGSAVSLKAINENALAQLENHKVTITNEEIYQEIRKTNILEKLLKYEFVDFFTKCHDQILSINDNEFLVEFVKKLAATESHYITQEIVVKVGNYLSIYDKEELIEAYYNVLENYKIAQGNNFYDIFSKLDIFDYQRISHLLRNEKIEIRKRGLEVSLSPKKLYSKDDIVDLNRLVKDIETNFPVNVEIYEKGSMFGGGKNVWKCRNAHEIADEFKNCSSCGLDMRGLQFEVYEKTIEKLVNRAKLVSKLLESKC